MTGLVGIISTQGEKTNIEDLLSKFCHVIKHENWYKIDTYVSKRIGLGRVHLGIFNPEPQPIYNEDKTICIFMDGEIYDYQDLKQELISKGHFFSIDNETEVILHLYEEYGIEFVHKLKGSFNIAIWDKKSKKMLLINDRYGLRPLYYTINNGDLLFGSEVKAILQDETFERTIDDRSVAEFFSFGFILGNKTFFEGIEILPPASIMSFETGNFSIEQYWDFHFIEEYEDHPEEYYIEELSRLILQAVERQMKGNHRIGVPLSGGLDSRTIIASINKKYYPIHSFTFGKPKCFDVRFAQRIAKKLGIAHHFFEFKPDDLVNYAEKAVYITDGMKNCIHSHRMQTYNEIRQFMDVALSGWIGDSTWGLRNNLQKYSNDSLNIFENDVANIFPKEILKSLFHEDYISIYEKNLEYYKNYILELGKNLDFEISFNKFQYFNLYLRQRRFSLLGPVLMLKSLEVRTPFSDYDFIDFILKIPPDLKQENNLYNKVFLRTFPYLANIPIQRTGLPLNAQHKYKLNTYFYKRFVNKICKKILKFKIFDDPFYFYDYAKWMRNNKRLRTYIYSVLLDERTLKRHYFNQNNLRKILDNHMSGNDDHSELIGRLLTFELWNRQFIDKY